MRLNRSLVHGTRRRQEQVPAGEHKAKKKNMRQQNKSIYSGDSNDAPRIPEYHRRDFA